ncbi:MAG: DnaJ domain-containing protein [Lachnospiraceae bacterium]|jgi:tetratricopeptide (TPR) repeat protein|nr:DnaJ domain-containing protein [Lachnospiraceae bacterium]
MRKDYEILGIEENADEKEIKKAYFQLIRKYSPEKNPERFQEIREAYERLTEEKDKPENNIQLEFPADNKLATQMFDQIQQLMQEQDYERAALTAKEGMKYYHDVECFLYMYARCCFLDGKTGKAVKCYEKLVKRYPDKLYYKSELAKAYHMRNFSRKAYAMFRKTYNEGWRETDFLNLFSLCCFTHRRYDEAVDILNELIVSIPSEKINQRISEILEAYTGLFLIYAVNPYPIDNIVSKCSAFLERIGNHINEYEDQLMQLYITIQPVIEIDEGDAIDLLAEKIQGLLPDFYFGEEPEDVQEAYELLEDERFSQLMKWTVEAFVLLDDMDYSGDSFDEYVNFMQLDIFLCLLEVWPKPCGELELMKKEYPNLYECGTDIWKMLNESKGNRAFMKEAGMMEYGKIERKFQCGHYFELYPDKRQNMDQLQWDSQEEGTFIRQNKKIGRNDPCSCGSGKKYKNCCGKGL